MSEPRINLMDRFLIQHTIAAVLADAERRADLVAAYLGRLVELGVCKTICCELPARFLWELGNLLRLLEHARARRLPGEGASLDGPIDSIVKLWRELCTSPDSFLGEPPTGPRDRELLRLATRHVRQMHDPQLGATLAIADAISPAALEALAAVLWQFRHLADDVPQHEGGAR